MNYCPMCAGAVEWREDTVLYECADCQRRWLSWPPTEPVLILGWKGMTWDPIAKTAVPLR